MKTIYRKINIIKKKDNKLQRYTVLSFPYRYFVWFIYKYTKYFVIFVQILGNNTILTIK